MIVYHTINYFRYDPNLLRHIHFLPPSFIFIAGFLITHLYLPKISAGDDQVPKRLLSRGLKTFALFLSLNIAIQWLVGSSYNRKLGLDSFINRIDVILLTGEGRAAVFGVLLPISYVLLVAAALLRIRSFAPHALHAAALLTCPVCIVLAHYGRLVLNLDLLSMGMLGTAAGFIPRHQLDRVARHLWLFVIAYAGYSVAVRFQYPTYLMNILGVSLSVLLLYSIGLRYTRRDVISANLTLLGNYSLFSYLVQIAVLQLLFRSAQALGFATTDVLLPLALTLVITTGAAHAAHFLRKRVSSADRLYRAVFA